MVHDLYTDEVLESMWDYLLNRNLAILMCIMSSIYRNLKTEDYKHF